VRPEHDPVAAGPVAQPGQRPDILQHGEIDGRAARAHQRHQPLVPRVGRGVEGDQPQPRPAGDEVRQRPQVHRRHLHQGVLRPHVLHLGHDLHDQLPLGGEVQ
jgi:hypothetical protein